MNWPAPTYHDIEQNSDEWLKLRAGRLTSSNIGKVMANYPKAFGEPAKKLAYQIAVERLTGKPAGDGYSNAHTERGHEQEPLARMAYEDQFFCSVENGGFFDCGVVGCSPDGLVDDGLIEIKSVIASQHFININRQKFDPVYKWQKFGNMLITGREWLDFISYCADFPTEKKLYVYRIYAKDYQEEFEAMKKRIDQFLTLVDSSMETIETARYCIL